MQTNQNYEKFILSKLSEIPIATLSNDYIIKSKLGQGSFGVVYLGYPKNNPNDLVAVKQLLGLATLIDTNQLLLAMVDIKSILNEVQILQKLDCHPHILCYRDFFIDSETNYIYLVTDYIKGLTLNDAGADILNKFDYTEQGYDAIYNLIVQVIKALAFVNQSGIIHGDIKPENIIVQKVTNGYDAFLIDFGLSCILQLKLDKCPFKGGSPLYVAPEVWTDKAITRKSDIWSLGITFYSVVMGKPYPNIMSEAQLKQTVTNPNLVPVFNTGYEKIDNLGNTMLLFDKKRPSASELIEFYNL